MTARGYRNLSASRATKTVGKGTIVCVGNEKTRAADALSECGGVVVSYRTVSDMMHNSPAGKVSMTVLENGESPGAIGKALSWIRHRWPRCCTVVVGEAGNMETELAARCGGAMFFPEPVAVEQWQALADHLLGKSEPDAPAEAVEAD